MQTSVRINPAAIVTAALPYVLAAIVFIALSFTQEAKSMDAQDCADFQPHAMQNGAVPPGMPGEHPHLHMPHSLFSELGLSDAQQKQVAEITQAQHNEVCAKQKAVHESMQALHQLAASEQFDAGKARALADAHGKAIAELAYLHAQTHAKVWVILTPEQRKQLEEKRAQFQHPHREADGIKK
jgi:Spy/CpxP family protein refolding chaperone